MSKQSKSQWDFGELFPPEPRSARPAPAEGTAGLGVPAPPRQVLSVSELTGQIRRLLEKQIGAIWVTGEVTNLKTLSSGHSYFTLKDAGAQLSCVLFRGEAVGHRELLQDGQKLLLQGDVTVYEARGNYQLIVRAIELQGIGALQIAFEKLKQKLQAEGLFAAGRKRPLPGYPQRIGLVTSPTGAAIRDVLHVARRRNPGLEIIFVPCRVQGDGAAREIAAAIRLLNEFSSRRSRREEALISTVKADQSLLTSSPAGAFLDLILITRGGGSLEDLWAFNEEAVARAIFESVVPVVSAVGHEIDFTISDFVADVRAATPSAAAEIITEGVFASRAFAAGATGRIGQLARQRLEGKFQEWSQLAGRFGRAHPRRRLNDALQRLDDLQAGLLRNLRQGTRQQRVAWQNLVERLRRARPGQVLKLRREQLQRGERRLRDRVRHQLRMLKIRLASAESKRALLGPDQVLARGYSITLDANSGSVLRNARQVKAGQKLRTRLAKGEVLSKVEKAG